MSEDSSNTLCDAPRPMERDAGIGLNRHTVEYLSATKGEPEWLKRQRLDALQAFTHADQCVPWAPDALRDLSLDSLRYYSAPAQVLRQSSGANNAIITETRISPAALGDDERNYAGTQVQVDGEVRYNSLQDSWKEQGVLFVDSSLGLTKYGDIFRPYYGSIVSRDENLFTLMNAAVFSGGSFIFIPPGVKLQAPLKCFMHLQARRGSQFGRTLIILGEGAELTFIESCTSVSSREDALHCAVGEFVLHPNSRLNYVALQNWKPNVYNLAILRATLARGASIQWIDCSMGGHLSMKYPCTLLNGDGASAEAVSVNFAHSGQHQDAGVKMLHRASHTTSNIISKSISSGTGRTVYRGRVDIPNTVSACRNHTECDALLLDAESRTETYPVISVRGPGNISQHEASVSRLDEEQIFYMQQRGLNQGAARSLSINGYINDIVQRFPIQYSFEIKRLIELQMTGSVG